MGHPSTVTPNTWFLLYHMENTWSYDNIIIASATLCTSLTKGLLEYRENIPDRAGYFIALNKLLPALSKILPPPPSGCVAKYRRYKDRDSK